MNKYFRKTLKIIFPFLLGGSILFWMYRELPLKEIQNMMLYEMEWKWMLWSFVPGILAQVFRGLRWKQTLEPIGQYPRTSTCIHAVFLSYAASLAIPRIGEFLRCGILSRYDSISFPKSLGTVVTERAVDTILMLLFISIVFFLQIHVFLDFFNLTGVSFDHIFSKFTSAGIFVTVLCGLCAIVFGILFMRKLAFMHKVKNIMNDITQGILSLKNIRNIPLYIIYSIGIWIAYFLHYYLTFFCFEFTEQVGIMASLVSFCMGTIAVIVPTPNGAGPWHFAVKTILVLYGLTAAQAASYALIVHSIQTLLLVLLGIYALSALTLTKVIKHATNEEQH